MPSLLSQLNSPSLPPFPPSPLQRQLDADVLVSGHTHRNSIVEYEGHCYVNPGSVTGAYSSASPASSSGSEGAGVGLGETHPSFMLMSVQEGHIEFFTYELIPVPPPAPGPDGKPTGPLPEGDKAWELKLHRSMFAKPARDSITGLPAAGAPAAAGAGAAAAGGAGAAASASGSDGGLFGSSSAAPAASAASRSSVGNNSL